MSPSLAQRPYGKTGEKVTVIGLGGGALARHGLADGVATVRRALELGINYFDNSPAYCQGASQVIMGTALVKCSEPHLLGTKLGYLATAADYRSPEALHAQLWENLRALRRDHVDILQVHLAEQACWWKDDVAPNELLDLHGHYDFADAPIMQVLHEAKERGVCRFIGITADHAEPLAHILRYVDVDACLLAYEYTLLERKARQTVLPVAREKKIAYIAAGVLKSVGVPSGHSHDDRLNRLQASSGLTLVALAIRYLLCDPAIATVLVGPTNPRELTECVAAAQDGPLEPELQQAIEQLSTY